MTSRDFARVIGILFLAVGVAGFVPGLKSSPPMTAGVFTTRCAPKFWVNSSSARLLKASVLKVAGVYSPSRIVTTGMRSSGRPAAIASPRAIRRMPSSSSFLTSGL